MNLYNHFHKIKIIANYINKKIYFGKYDCNELISFVSDRPGHDYRYAINNNKIEKLGWKPNKKNFLKYLYLTIDWYISNNKKLCA